MFFVSIRELYDSLLWRGSPLGGCCWCVKYSYLFTLSILTCIPSPASVMHTTSTLRVRFSMSGFHIYDITLDRATDCVAGIILCIAWHVKSDAMVTGGVGIIRVWSVTSGHALHRFTLDGRNVAVWSVVVTRCGSIHVDTYDWPVSGSRSVPALFFGNGCFGGVDEYISFVY